MNTNTKKLNSVLAPLPLPTADIAPDHFRGLVAGAYRILEGVEDRHEACSLLLERSWEILRHSSLAPDVYYIEAGLPIAELAFHFAEVESRDLPELDNCTDDKFARLTWQIERAWEILDDLLLDQQDRSPDMAELHKQVVSLIPEVEEAIEEDEEYHRYLDEMRGLTTDQMLGTPLGFIPEAKNGAIVSPEWQDM